jgi:hypothetical protein
MRMDSSSVFRFKRNTVYGLPTWEGLAMFFVVGVALWFSLTLRAPIEQWISFLMILLILVHLLESNTPFRDLSIQILRFDPPYGSEDFLIPVQITNPTSVASEPLQFRLAEKDWTFVASLAPKTSQIVFLPHSALSAGRHSLPDVRFKMRPASGLFRLWRVTETQQKIFVMPAPTNHDVQASANFGDSGEPELSHLEFIHDPRLLPKMDQKLFQKTGKPFLRVHESDVEAATLYFDWDLLSLLSPSARQEQFSAWIKDAETLRKTVPFRLMIHAPFYEASELSESIHFRNLKEAFAVWAAGET